MAESPQLRPRAVCDLVRPLNVDSGRPWLNNAVIV
jgi:hypothetical protein